jgi:aspartate aminotransferase
MRLAERVTKITASQSLAMAARAKAMKAAGADVVSMSLGEPDFDTPEHVRRAAQEAIDNHWSHYGPVPGIPSLREAIAKQQNGRGNAIPYTADDVVVSVGAKMAIYSTIQTIVGAGDEVIIPEPCYVSYVPCTTMADGVPVIINLKNEKVETVDLSDAIFGVEVRSDRRGRGPSAEV